ncbi:MAG: alpha/beta fold hydrolase [Chromatocurvus sp.]
MSEAQVEPIVFENRAGLKLFGILHTPLQARAGAPAILLLSPGIKMRVGPNLLYRSITDRLVGMGYSVFRFDFFGLGDSEGELSETRLADVYNHIEVGRYVEDTLDAMDFMQREYGIGKFILGGLCGGAVSGLLTAGRDPRAVGLLGLGLTVVLASAAADPLKYMPQGQAKLSRQAYFMRALRPSSWLRLLTLQSDFKLLWASFSTPFKKLRPARGAQPEAGERQVQMDNRNPLIPKAVFPVLDRGGKILLIFSGADRLLDEFQEKFAAGYKAALARHADGFQVRVVKDANHIFSQRAWRDEMLDDTERWLNRHFPSGNS